MRGERVQNKSRRLQSIYISKKEGDKTLVPQIWKCHLFQ